MGHILHIRGRGAGDGLDTILMSMAMGAIKLIIEKLRNIFLLV
jgi:hypothetical protein